MNFSAKPTNQSPDAVYCMRGFTSELCHQIIDKHTGSYARVTVSLQRAWRISPCWQVTNDRLCELSSQNRVRNCGSSTYSPSRAVTVVKHRNGNLDGSTCGKLRRKLGRGALRDGSIRKQRSQSLNCAHKRSVRTAVRLTPIRNNM